MERRWGRTERQWVEEKQPPQLLQRVGNERRRSRVWSLSAREAIKIKIGGC
jgi:hypothetical protein